MILAASTEKILRSSLEKRQIVVLIALMRRNRNILSRDRSSFYRLEERRLKDFGSVTIKYSLILP